MFPKKYADTPKRVGVLLNCHYPRHFEMSQFREGHAPMCLQIHLRRNIHNIHTYWHTHSLTDWLTWHNTLALSLFVILWYFKKLPLSIFQWKCFPSLQICTYQIAILQSEYTYWIARTPHQLVQPNHPKLGRAQCWWAKPAMPTLPRWPTLFGEQGLLGSLILGGFACPFGLSSW